MRIFCIKRSFTANEKRQPLMKAFEGVVLYLKDTQKPKNKEVQETRKGTKNEERNGLFFESLN